MIEGRRKFIVTNVLDPEEVSEDGFVDNDVAESDQENERGLVEAGLKTGVTQSGTEEV